MLMTVLRIDLRIYMKHLKQATFARMQYVYFSVRTIVVRGKAAADTATAYLITEAVVNIPRYLIVDIASFL